ncbi:hypothetical protein Z957_12365 [Clostridium sp. K25]|uniref:Abortive infection bacteriophage resistance protein n=1 Tax=Clostridium novyi B str. ATCC 27606 TaxID=1443123 RepID=A0AA40IVH5_CLONO|nr:MULTISPECIES: Abi family protein [Clostridium]KEI10834.1 hypothetical protein Z957_12365 [Clostridium sp. K25]KEI17795.1 hypothetical protein Z959_06000 [Clostridium novyi B str. ATCC 27606]
MDEENKLKEPKTFEEQLNILKSRHMIIKNDKEAIKILAETNYYRLTAYALQFKKNDEYNGKITFNNMYNLYQFDKKLRNLLLGILETIEISLRTYIAYTLSLEYGSEAHTNIKVYQNPKFYEGYIAEDGYPRKGLKDEIEIQIKSNSKELLVKHHINKYDGHFPLWVIVEILSFGMISKMYSNLKTEDKKKISRSAFNTTHILLESWIESLSHIRNICAHYGRLYNKKLKISPKIHNKYKKFKLDSKRLFVCILAIKELTVNSEEWLTFKIGLESLIEQYEDVINLTLIGFPENWGEVLEL